MDVMMTLPAEPKQDAIPQQMLIIRLCFEAAEQGDNLLAQLAASPGHVFAKAGFPVDYWSIPAFDDFCRKEAGFSEVLQHLGKGGTLAALSGVGCTLCKIAAYTLAIALVAVGAAALTFLTAGSAVVLAVAAFAGVGVVATQICEWTGACE